MRVRGLGRVKTKRGFKTVSFMVCIRGYNTENTNGKVTTLNVGYKYIEI